MPPDGAQPQRIEVFVPPVTSLPTFPTPGTRSPLDIISTATLRPQRPDGTAVGGTAALPWTSADTRAAYVIDLDGRFDAPLVRPLPAK
jgi:hypothetical protein